MALEPLAWLNAEFMEKVLRKSEKDESIRVIDVSVKPATNIGDNYSSEMHRATANFTRDHNGRRITEKTSVVVKILPEGSNQHRENVEDAGFFETEISMMSETLVEMNRLLGSVKPFGAQCLYARSEKPTLLVVEDLAPLGFRMADRQAGLDLDHCLIAIRGMAKFHATSVALYEKDSAAVRKYNKGICCKDYPVLFQTAFKDALKTFGEEVAKWTELDPRYSERILKLSTVFYEKASEAIAFKETDFNVLNHGDMWTNNMLFRYGDQGKPIDYMLVDFQLSVYTSPAIDLLYFLHTSPTEEVRINSHEFLLREYQSVLESTMLQLNCKTTAPKLDELKRSMKDRAMHGVTAAFVVLPTVLIEKNEAKKVSEMIDENGAFQNPAYKGKTFRNVMLRMLPIFDKMGLLDV